MAQSSTESLTDYRYLGIRAVGGFGTSRNIGGITLRFRPTRRREATKRCNAQWPHLDFRPRVDVSLSRDRAVSSVSESYTDSPGQDGLHTF